MEVDNFNKAVELLTAMGCRNKAYQESKREIWRLDNAEVTIDKWPFLETFVEAEGQSEKAVKAVSEKIGFDYGKALFCVVGTLYRMKYGISENIINNRTPRIIFGGHNPFIKKRKY
jgi:hypothetical protein